MIRLTVKQSLLKVCSVAAFTAVAAGTFGTGQAQGLVLTFDDLPLTSDVSPIPNGYGGLNWTNFYYLNSQTFDNNPSGYLNGRVSAPNVAFNAFAQPASVSTVTLGSGTFNFNSTYLTAAWNNGLSILVEGFLGGITKYATTVTVDTTSPTLFNFDFLGIDSLKFTSFGGVNAGYNGVGEHFALDNFTYNSETVPEPTTILGLLTVGSFGVALSRKQKQQQKAASKV